VRACQNRALERHAETESAEKYVREQPLAAPVLFTQEIQVCGRHAKIANEKRGRRQSRESRTAAVAVRATAITLRPPYQPDRKLSPVKLNVVLVREIDPPVGEEPIEWILLTNLPIDNEELVRQIIQYYCVRWMIEIFFRVLKPGCRVEERRFEQLDLLLCCLAVYLIVSWRTLYVCRLGRGCPDISCEAIFEPAEGKATWKVTQNQDPPAQTPTLGELLPIVAELGGYVTRPNALPPGPQTIWLGLQRVYDFGCCWKMCGPETRAVK